MTHVLPDISCRKCKWRKQKYSFTCNKGTPRVSCRSSTPWNMYKHKQIVFDFILYYHFRMLFIYVCNQLWTVYVCANYELYMCNQLWTVYVCDQLWTVYVCDQLWTWNTLHVLFCIISQLNSKTIRAFKMNWNTLAD